MEEDVGAGVNRLLRGVGRKGGYREKRERGCISSCREEAGSRRRALVPVFKGQRGWGRGGTQGLHQLRRWGRESIDIFCRRNKTGHCIKGTVQHNLWYTVYI